MPEYVIADTSVFIIFDKLDRFDVLKAVYPELYTTPEIIEEYQKTSPDWITIESPKDKKYQAFVETQVDSGEASAIAFAIEKENALLILDDLKARKLAKRLDLKYTGTLGVINKAKALGVISKIKPLLDGLQKTDFRISENVVRDLLQRNGE